MSSPHRCTRENPYTPWCGALVTHPSATSEVIDDGHTLKFTCPHCGCSWEEFDEDDAAALVRKQRRSKR